MEEKKHRGQKHTTGQKYFPLRHFIFAGEKEIKNPSRFSTRSLDFDVPIRFLAADAIARREMTLRSSGIVIGRLEARDRRDRTDQDCRKIAKGHGEVSSYLRVSSYFHCANFSHRFAPRSEFMFDARRGRSPPRKTS